MSDFTRVERPKTHHFTGFSAALERTLSTGDALSMPLNGETYAVRRNRSAGQGAHVARRLHASLRTAKSDDGLSVLIWLEPKSNGTGE